MRRWLGTETSASGALAIVAAVALSATALVAAQSDRKVTLHSLSAYDTLYVLSGGEANAVALMRDDGVVLIDPLPIGWGKASLEAIQTVSDQPVKTIVNLRGSDEDLRANAEYPTATQIVAHQNLATRAKGLPIFSGQGARFLPTVLVNDRLSLFDGPDKMDLYYFGPGRTDGDLMIVFPEKRMAYAGDLLPGKAVPVVEPGRGGSGLMFPDTLAKVVSTISGVRTVVPGREAVRFGQVGAAKSGAVMPMSVTMNWKDLQEYAEFTREFVTAVRAAKAGGEAAPERAAARLSLPEKFKAYDMRAAAATTASIYSELGK